MSEQSVTGGQTTWGYRLTCPACGHEGVTQSVSLRNALIHHHERRVHDGRSVCEWTREEAVPVSAFPDRESPGISEDSVEVTADV